jgi:glycosyltransferase involved in cell wall biosynthesis
MAIVNGHIPRISIVVPSFNQGHFLGQTLESIFSQNYPDLEVVVIDGGSTDTSVDVIRAYEDLLKYWQSQPDEGQSAAINEGVTHCTGEIVGWLNSDDFYWGDSLWTIARAYATFPGRGLYIGNGLRFNQAEGIYTPFCHRHIALNRAALTEGLDYILQPATFFLRQAWEELQGLEPSLRFCMDWDIILRIAQRYPAVLINEFLAVSREYEETKTSSGKINRAIEIMKMIQGHSRREATPGTIFYLLETLLGMTDESSMTQLRYHLYEGMLAIQEDLRCKYGNKDGFPTIGDPQDEVYVPLADQNPFPKPHSATAIALPSISIVTPSFNQGQFIRQTLDSMLSQGYPELETLVFDAGSTDATIDILRQYGDSLTFWVSEPDTGPANAINKGFARASGEILAWLNSDDVLSTDALWEVGRAFAADPDLDMVFANALYIDEESRLFLADHGTHQTGLYYGEMQPIERVPAYWSYVYQVPQPTVFFRRRLLEQCGTLDESYHFIFDFELFWRFMWKAKIKKIERVQAFYRIHANAKTSNWNKFLVELYRFSRPWWPRVRSPEFRATLQDFMSSYLNRRFGNRPVDIWLRGVTAAVRLVAITGIGNPEAFQFRRPRITMRRRTTDQRALPAQQLDTPEQDPVEPPDPEPLKPEPYMIDTTQRRYRSLFCGYLWPRHPGHSGGEIRDFHLLRRLLSISSVEYFVVHDPPPDERSDLLLPFVDALHTPQTTQAARPYLFHSEAFRRTLKSRIASQLRRRNLPVVGPRYHNDVADQYPAILAASRAPIQEAIEQRSPDFLFVSPQTNPLALTLATRQASTRLILASYDVEAVRMRRIAATYRGFARFALDLEVRRASYYEHINLAMYDGIIAVSELDKRLFIHEYGFPAERIVVIENGVDPQYFSFKPRYRGRAAQIIYTGSLTYLPNKQAAWRLIRQIMPLVRHTHPDACLWIVGQGADLELIRQSDGVHTVVTGKVPDVRPYLENASLACVPLIAGSGTKYKVIEALSAGVPLVCSPLAAEGLAIEDGTQALLAQSDLEVATAIVRLLDDADLADRLARQGRMLIEQHYSWDVNLVHLDPWLDLIASMPKHAGDPYKGALEVSGAHEEPQAKLDLTHKYEYNTAPKTTPMYYEGSEDV